MLIRCGSIDPSMRNFGMAKIDLDLATLKISVVDMKLIETEKRAGKQVRKNSDDLRRSQEINVAFHDFVSDCRFVFAEIPTGAQSAAAMFSFGLVVGILGGCPKPLIQVQPFETKLATVGTKTASKEEMIEWAEETYPDAPWIRLRGRMTLKNEHLADALAVSHAGVNTDEFRRMIALYRQAA